MNDLTLFREIRLIPVLELEPWVFSTVERPRPSGSVLETPEGWARYWLDSLADSGITGLTPLRPGSWHVQVHQLGDPETLEKILRIHTRDVDGIEAPIDAEEIPTLSGGLALLSKGEVLIEPTCCSDLGNLFGMAERCGIPAAGMADALDRPPLAVCPVRRPLARHQRAA